MNSLYRLRETHWRAAQRPRSALSVKWSAGFYAVVFLSMSFFPFASKNFGLPFSLYFFSLCLLISAWCVFVALGRPAMKSERELLTEARDVLMEILSGREPAPREMHKLAGRITEWLLKDESESD